MVKGNRIVGLGLRWLPLLLWMAAIYYASSQAKADIPSFGLWDQLVKKGGHFLAYALLTLLAWRVTRESERPYLLAFLIALLYAMSDEWHQSFVPTRYGSPIDILIDGLGGLSMLALLFQRQRHLSREAP